MITSIRRAALDRWLTRAGELIDEQLARDAETTAASPNDGASEQLVVPRLRRWRDGAEVETVIGMWTKWEPATDDAVDDSEIEDLAVS
jgi:hypothetical protein